MGEGQMITVFVEPMGAPRMTRADAWKKRPVVLRYRAYKDEIRKACEKCVETDVVTVKVAAYFSMPESWSVKKKIKNAGMLHRVKPDVDNCAKGILDAILEQDSCVADLIASKRWVEPWGDARLEITINGDV
jgi:Holliday junction resolvase RusA-like endonuclease